MISSRTGSVSRAGSPPRRRPRRRRSRPPCGNGSRGCSSETTSDRPDRMPEPTQGADLALVFSGGGARAAYQVGFLRLLAREFPEIVPGIVTGVSAGGINAAYLASRQEPFAQKVEDLARVWEAIHI